VGPRRAATVGCGTAQLTAVAGATSAAILSREKVATRLITRCSGRKRSGPMTSFAICGRTASKTISLWSSTCWLEAATVACGQVAASRAATSALRGDSQMRLDAPGAPHRPVTIEAVMVPVPTNPSTRPSRLSIVAAASAGADI